MFKMGKNYVAETVRAQWEEAGLRADAGLGAALRSGSAISLSPGKAELCYGCGQLNRRCVVSFLIPTDNAVITPAGRKSKLAF